MAKFNSTGLDEHQKACAKLMIENARKHNLATVFRDFCEMSALAISNSVDFAQAEAREARYLQIVKSYTPDEISRFCEMHAKVIESLESGFSDCLGELFMSLELGDDFKGQFFTPYPVSRLMAGLTLGNVDLSAFPGGYITINDPAVGAGSMLIAAAHALKDQGINYQRLMHATACDIDATAVHMAYIQLSLLHVPAIVIHGNSLSLAEWGHWVTPAHVLGNWDYRLRWQADIAQADSALENKLLLPASASGSTDVAVPATVELEAVRTHIVAKRVTEQLSLFG